MNRFELLSAGYQAPKNTSGILALESFLAKEPNSTEANGAKLRLTRRLLAKKQYDRAYELLGDVLKGGSSLEKQKARMLYAYVQSAERGPGAGQRAFVQIAKDESLDKATRLHALRQVAANAHVAQDMTSAVLAFKQLGVIAPTAAERADARLEHAGLAFELVGRQKGTWDEVLVLCSEVAAMSGASRQTIATARLMHLEAQFYLGKYALALQECDALLSSHRDVRREWITVLVWKGVLLTKLGRSSEAESVLQSVLSEDIADSDKFGNHEPKARAAYWLAHLAVLRGDTVSRDTYCDIIKRDYPQSIEASRANNLTLATQVSANPASN
jgi:hypothetical protein